MLLSVAVCCLGSDCCARPANLPGSKSHIEKFLSLRTQKRRRFYVLGPGLSRGLGVPGAFSLTFGYEVCFEPARPLAGVVMRASEGITGDPAQWYFKFFMKSTDRIGCADGTLGERCRGVVDHALMVRTVVQKEQKTSLAEGGMPLVNVTTKGFPSESTTWSPMA